MQTLNLIYFFLGMVCGTLAIFLMATKPHEMIARKVRSTFSKIGTLVFRTKAPVSWKRTVSGSEIMTICGEILKRSARKADTFDVEKGKYTVEIDVRMTFYERKENDGDIASSENS